MKDKIDCFRGEYFWLSNTYESPLHVPGGLSFRSAEHAYQWCKTDNDWWQDRIRNAEHPLIAKKIANHPKCPILPNWDDIKVRVMERVVYYKFNDPVLREKLLDTGDAYIEEGNTWGDTFWGVCKGVGENNLGKILMKTREKFRENY